MLKKLCRNPILVLDTLGGTVRFIGFAGYWINKPRYIEAQFNQSAARSSLLTGEHRSDRSIEFPLESIDIGPSRPRLTPFFF